MKIFYILHISWLPNHINHHINHIKIKNMSTVFKKVEELSDLSFPVENLTSIL